VGPWWSGPVGSRPCSEALGSRPCAPLTLRASIARMSPVCAQGAPCAGYARLAELDILRNNLTEAVTPAASCGVQAVPPAAGVPRGLTIRCARVAGVEIPNNKRIETALTYIHGIGTTTSRQVLLDVGLENKPTKELTEEELTRLR